MSAADIKAAVPDSDGTLDKKEFAALSDLRFKAADPDNDGTVDDKELAPPTGEALLTPLPQIRWSYRLKRLAFAQRGRTLVKDAHAGLSSVGLKLDSNDF